ncbi:MAG: hypothetical protein V1913_02190, partial [Fibrobacterota bacterium]
ITIRKGTVLLADSALRFLTIDNIDGTFTIGRATHRFSLSGRFPGTDTRAVISGSADPTFKGFEISVRLAAASFIRPVPLGEHLSVNSGQMDLDLRVTKTAGRPLEATALKGDLSLNHLSLTLPGGFGLSDLTGRFVLTDSGLRVEKCGARLLDRPLTLSGTVEHPFHPEFALRLSADQMDLAHPDLRNRLSGRKLSGLVNLTAAVTGPLRSPEVSAELNAERIVFNNRPFHHPAASLLFRRDTLHVVRATADGLSGTLSGQGFFRLSEPAAYGIHATVKSADLFTLAQNSGGPRKSAFDIALSVRNDGNGLRVNGNGNGRLTGQPELGAFTLRFQTTGRALGFSLRNKTGGAVLSGDIADFADHPDIRAKFSFKDVPWEYLTGTPPPLNREPITLSADFRVAGPLEKIRVAGSVYPKGEWADGTLLMNGLVDNSGPAPQFQLRLFSDTLSLLGEKAPFSCALSRKGEVTSLEDLQYGRTLKGRMVLTDDRLDGELSFSAFPLALSHLLSADEFRSMAPSGLLSGQCRLSGSADAPGYSADLSLAEGRLGELTQVRMTLSLSGKGRDWTVSRLSAETPRERLFISDSLRFVRGKLLGNFRIENLNLAALFGEKSGVSGSLSLMFESAGKGTSTLHLGSNQLHYRDFRLDYLKATAVERNGVATIGKFAFGMGDFTGEAAGFIPLPFSTGDGPPSDTLDLTVDAKGEVLGSLAPLLSSFAKKAQGRGSIRLRFTGNSKNIRLINGYVDVTKDKNAFIQPTAYLPGKIGKISLFAGINNGVVNLEANGTVQGSRLRITSERKYEKAENLKIEALGLDFGVLRVYTPSEGVSINLPFLIPEGEYGEVELLDKRGSPGFIVTGPLKQPWLVGKVRAHNCRFSVPFLQPPFDTTGRGNVPPPVHLDFTVIAGNNLKYFYNYRNTSAVSFLDRIIKNRGLRSGIDKGMNLFNYPLTELTLERTSWLSLHGNPGHQNFKIMGRATSSKGYVHYAGQDFNQNVDVGLEFDQADNIPILWGSASSIIRSTDRSESGNEITVTLYVRDPKTGVETKRGKLKQDFRLVPSSNLPLDETGDPGSTAYQKVLGTDFGKDPSSVQNLARSEGKAMFEKVFLQRMVTNYVERTVLGFGRENLNPLVGFDITPDVFRVEIESGKVFNYIDMSAWSLTRLRKDFLENAEFITGKYFFSGTLFLNYSSQLDMTTNPEGMDVEKLHHRVGFELTPWRYLYLNMDYEIGGLPRAIGGAFDRNDVRSNVRLRLPIKKIQDLFIKDNKQPVVNP